MNCQNLEKVKRFCLVIYYFSFAKKNDSVMITAGNDLIRSNLYININSDIKKHSVTIIVHFKYWWCTVDTSID